MTRSVYSFFLFFLCFVRVVRPGNSYVPPGNDYDSFLNLPSGPYLDIFPLSGKNFTERVLKSKDPWIVVFHEGVVSRNWRAMAESLRGVVWVGMIDRGGEKGLLDEIEYATLDNAEAIIYPYGEKSLRNRETARNANDAKFKALKSLPDVTKKLDINLLQNFLLESYVATPSRFPTVIITEEEEMCPLFKALTLRFGKYFNFARLVKPSPEDFESLGTGNAYIDVPTVLILVTDSIDAAKNPEFKAVLYTKESFGEMNYPNLLHFFFTVNRQFRYTLPNIGQLDHNVQTDMEEIMEIERKRFDTNARYETEPAHNGGFESRRKILQFDEVTKQEL